MDIIEAVDRRLFCCAFSCQFLANNKIALEFLSQSCPYNPKKI